MIFVIDTYNRIILIEPHTTIHELMQFIGNQHHLLGYSIQVAPQIQDIQFGGIENNDQEL